MFQKSDGELVAQTPTHCSFIALIILISYPVSPWCLHSGPWGFFPNIFYSQTMHSIGFFSGFSFGF